MIDCHSHILPNFDDGAKDTETALAMLSLSYGQGVRKVISTSHCYPRRREDVLKFITERNEAFSKLREDMEKSKNPYPEIFTGAELNMLTDVSEYDEIENVCINNTKYILIEMPMSDWKDWMIEAVYKLTVRGFKPIMAHINRYLGQKESLLEELHELGVFYQINADAFTDKTIRRHTFKLMESGKAHILGTDMHNMGHRKPNMSGAVAVIEKYFGRECVDYFNKNAQAVLDGGEIVTASFSPKPLFERLFKK